MRGVISVKRMFQKDLIVWKRHLHSSDKFVIGRVSEGLNSVETTYRRRSNQLMCSVSEGLNSVETRSSNHRYRC